MIEISFVFINFFSKKSFYLKNLKLKIASSAFTGWHMESIWNTLASLGLRWWQHMIVRGLNEHYVASEVIFF